MIKSNAVAGRNKVRSVDCPVQEAFEGGHGHWSASGGPAAGDSAYMLHDPGL